MNHVNYKCVHKSLESLITVEIHFAPIRADVKGNTCSLLDVVVTPWLFHQFLERLCLVISNKD